MYVLNIIKDVFVYWIIRFNSNRVFKFIFYTLFDIFIKTQIKFQKLHIFTNWQTVLNLQHINWFSNF